MSAAMNPLAMPEPVAERLQRLNELVTKHPMYIPVTEAAALMGMEAASLRASIDSGNCPFALGWQKDIKGYKAYKVPTVPFYLWFTQGVGFRN